MSKEQALEALWRLTYGLYVVTSRQGERINGQITDALAQVTLEPPRIALSVNKAELTHDFLAESGVLGVSVLAQSAPIDLILLFGFRSGRDVNKFEYAEHKTGVTGVPLLTKNVVAVFEGKVVERVDLGTHTVFIAEIVEGEVLSPAPALTYTYYQEHLRGRTHKNAPTYRPAAVKKQPQEGDRK
ncbi:MAG TPA: flavin reductase family protein [Phycisphaerae bacterium]|nr:flavin reductase family protein [Phycisphaerae bacterium]